MKFEIRGGDGWEIHYESTPANRERLGDTMMFLAIIIGIVAIAVLPILLVFLG